MKNTVLDEVVSLQVETIDRTSDFFKKMTKWNRMLLSPPPVKTGQTPSEVVYRKHKTKLLHYLPSKKKVSAIPVLISFALVNKPYILDLIPGKSVVEFLVNNGFDVYMIDWGIPSDSDSNLGLETYVEIYMDRAVDYIRRQTGAEGVTLMGYCMGGAMAMMYTALHQEKVANLILMATPFDFSANDGILFQWSKDFPVDELTEIYGNCPGWYLNLSFASLKPTGLMDKGVNLYKNLLDEDFLTLFLAMEKWSNDAQPVAGKAYGQFIRDCFQKNLLMKNRFVLGDKTVDISKITCPVLNLIADKDNLVPPSSSEAICEHIGSSDTETIRCKTGHIGLSVSGRAYKEIWPQTVKWLQARSGKKINIQVKEK